MQMYKEYAIIYQLYDFKSDVIMSERVDYKTMCPRVI